MAERDASKFRDLSKLQKAFNQGEPKTKPETARISETKPSPPPPPPPQKKSGG